MPLMVSLSNHVPGGKIQSSSSAHKAWFDKLTTNGCGGWDRGNAVENSAPKQAVLVSEITFGMSLSKIPFVLSLS